MHDVVRSFAHYVSRNEALVFQKGHIDFGDTDSIKIFRLSIESKGSVPNELDWSVIQKQKSLRTLMLYGSIMLKPHDALSSFSSLWVLYMVQKLMHWLTLCVNSST
uniref:Uncharacterized protein n=1 Tax=Arundo donax TaxID=35708 RepID=A0A0A9AWY8_ARUDO